MKYKRIFLVDDDIDDRLIFAELLKTADPQVQLQTAGNGIEMVAALEKSGDGELPDLIILDQNMPKMNGKDTLIYLKENSRYRQIRTIMYSTWQPADFHRECMEIGASDIVAKPGTMQAYREMIERFLLHPTDTHPDAIEPFRSCNI